MSADNWTICPKCRVEVSRKVDSAYGKVSEEEYLRLVEANKNKDRNPTLSEYYWLGVDKEGTFKVNYSCYCTVCDFKYEYKTEIDVSIDWGK